MKKLLIVLAAGTLIAEEPQSPSPLPENNTPAGNNAVKFDAMQALHDLQAFGKKTFTDMHNAPSSHVVAGAFGFFAAALVCRRFSGVSRLHRKFDELARLIKEQKK